MIRPKQYRHNLWWYCKHNGVNSMEQQEVILITGVAGLLGSRLAEWIIKNKPRTIVIGVDDLSGGYIENIHSQVTFYKGDMGDPVFMERIFRTHTPTIVFHCGAYAAEALSPFIRRFNYTNNLTATANIINMCINYHIKRLVFTSSMAVYGEQHPPFHEDMTPSPIDPYGVAKYACEMDIRIAGEQHKLDWCILRPHNVYGRGQNIWDNYRNFIGICMYKVIADDPITIYGDGLQKRAFSYIDDALEPMWNAGVLLSASKQIINLGGIQKYTILDVAQQIIDITGKGDIIHLPPRHEVRNAYSTWKKSVDILKFNGNTSLSSGIQDMWEWAQQQPKRERLIWKEYEIESGIYPQWKQEALKDGYWRVTSP
jgi:UDP-glucose 4-epimerase